MKIKKLRLAGFGPFKSEQFVDFEAFDADGIFLITGKTGAGKSSILDAICFALYGQVPRFSGSEQQLRSDHCAATDPTYVELDFAINDTDYRLLRTPQYERAKKNGSGMTTAAPTAILQIKNRDGWRGIAAKPGAVGQELAAILPLKQDQFLQVILLAQNRFQRFLLAKTEERREVLRNLCGSSRFAQLETDLILRRKGLDDELGAVQRAIAEHAAAAAHQLRLVDGVTNPDLAWFTTALSRLRDELDQAAVHVESAAEALTRAAAEDNDAAETARRQGRRAAAAAKLLVLDEQHRQVTQLRAVLNRAVRAARVWPQIRSSRAAEVNAAAANAGEADARACWLDLRRSTSEHMNAVSTDGPGVAEGVVLQKSIDELLGRLGALGAALLDEEQLPGLDSEVGALAASLVSSTTALAAAEARLDVLPTEIEKLAANHSMVAVAAAGEKQADAERIRVRAALQAAEDVVACQRTADLASDALLERSRENTAAALSYEALLARRFAGHAQELASQLLDGTPCSVCGSPEHPNPATVEAEPVTELDLERSRTVMLERQESLTAAHGLVSAASARLAEVKALASNRGVGELRLEVESAEEVLRAIRGASEQLGRLALELAQHREELASEQAGLVNIRAERDAVAATHGERTANRDLLRARVSAHHAGFASIGAQMNELQRELDAARALHAALALSREREASRDAAVAALRSETDREGFTDEADAVDARLDDARIREVETEVRDYDDALAAARAASTDPELAGLPTEPVDREPFALALQQAGSARDAAFRVHSSLAERTGQLGRLVADVTTQFAASAEVISRHNQVRQLADVVHGEEPNTKRMRLETYVLAAELEQIVAAANTRLRTMTSGRYTLEHDDSAEYRGGQSGLGLAIRDEHTGRARATHSLSGGETFLASLSLALGLAEVVTGQAGGVTLDTLFVDEGFGSLDAETLETAMGTLDALRAGGRTVGLISHVESMKEQVPASLNVVVTDAGPSAIAQENHR
ncbi:AAA family ATPase [Cryobacterium psychrophilum]|uniref:Nuclease SbcCD subunit C n=1 Tax=Cryobacterium psychrophilum TaxID=41988 RepID=A0A4Y8KS62_9MICO|nr:AAA family ATPase [Cryobacterium psychrophilum]TDW29303.1 exonuclease SbcC [Cryobacterium psychrophilum]TFD79979.1 hypothetical protein E3T53_06140 [Cryobacterium psychrophilum]